MDILEGYSVKWTINRKLLGGFSVVIMILIFVIGVGYYQIKTLNNNYNFLIEDRVMKSIEIKNLHIASKEVVSSAREFLLVGDEQTLQSYNKAKEEYQKTYDRLSQKIKIDTHIQALVNFNQFMNEYMKLTEQLFRSNGENSTNNTSLASTSIKVSELILKSNQEVVKLVDFQMQLLEKGIKDNTSLVNKAVVQILVLGLIAVLIGIGTALIMARLISKPVTTLADSAIKIANGDLTVNEIQVKNRDEIGDLSTAFNDMTRNLRRLIEQVSLNSIQVASSAEELTASAEQTTKATNQISVSIQEVASGAETQGQGANESSIAMKEMSKGIQQMSKATAAVSDLATDTSNAAINGHHSLQKVISQMNIINEVVGESSSMVKNLGDLSKEIGDITGVITAIADQTNLLALNAAIEAARAGEQGRGFSVVADEVKKLAEQSKESADQISSLISRIQGDTILAVNVMDKGTQEVETGITVVHEAEEGFQKILRLIEQVNSQTHEASAVSEEMYSGVEQISASIEEIARIAQISAENMQNVASASEEQLASMEEISSSSSVLSKMAEELQTHVSHFKI